MLRIKRAVQASFNTENSFIAAQAAAAAKGSEKPTDSAKQVAKDAADPMAAMERDMAAQGKGGSKPAGAPMFVASTQNRINANGIEEGDVVETANGNGDSANPDAIQVDDDDM